ncbi:MAG: aminoacetone oxidase family FAD-binding enzyme [Gemmatimonadales bacterium]
MSVLPVVIVGGGAAGCMAAIAAAGIGASVLLLERTRDGGRKILISGGGRCNILPSVLDPGRFVTDSSPHLLRKMLASWPLDQQRHFFETDLGIPLELEAESGKLFPTSNRARDVRDRLISAAGARGAVVRFEALVRDIVPANGGWSVQLEGGAMLEAAAVVLATGGLSVPTTGSDGIGLTIARQLQHQIHPLYPALTPLLAASAEHAALSGISLTVSLEGTRQGKRASTTGGFLFTHRGYSGPSVLDLSDIAVRSRQNGGPREELRVQWGAIDRAGWDTRLQSRGAQSVLTVVREQLPARLAEVLLGEAGIEPAHPVSQLSRERRLALLDLLTRYPLPWTGDEGYRKAEVTGGGVALSEVQSATLESRRHPGLFLCGEMLDAFGPIGGYNFAWAWATGRAAGLGAARAGIRG